MGHSAYGGVILSQFTEKSKPRFLRVWPRLLGQPGRGIPLRHQPGELSAIVLAWTLCRQATPPGASNRFTCACRRISTNRARRAGSTWYSWMAHIGFEVKWRN